MSKVFPNVLRFYQNFDNLNFWVCTYTPSSLHLHPQNLKQL